MIGSNRPLFVISDLHLGGEPGHRNGFRMMTNPGALAAFVDALTALPEAEILVAGDFVDFLAERVRDDERPAPAPPGDRWVPFRSDPVAAEAVFRRVALRPDGDGPIFDALARFCARPDHVLTVMLGNHDLELSLPEVREALRERLGARVELLDDNQAFRRGPVVVEHGNRYDRFNQVDHDALRRLRSHLSRGLPHETAPAFAAPAGSQLVAAVMNPVKSMWPFVDLLKPETAAVVPTLLALDPGRRDQVGDLLRHLGPAVANPTRPDGAFAAPISALEDAPENDPLEALLAARLATGDPAYAEPVSALDDLGTARAWLGLLRGTLPSEGRVRALWRALRSLWRDESFSRDVETDPAYLDAATFLRDAGAGVVVFGHTHLPKDIHLYGGGRYLNCGTWADRIRLPLAVFDPDPGRSLSAVRDFAEDLRAGAHGAYVHFEPTYVRLDWDGARLLGAQLCVWTGAL